MTEAEWLACTDPQKMLEFLRGSASERKLRLFAVGCCRRIWHLLTDERSRMAVAVAERHVDVGVSEEEFRAANISARDAFRTAITPACQNANNPRTAGCAAALAARRCFDEEAIQAACGASYQSANATVRSRVKDWVCFQSAWGPAFLVQSLLLRDIFGNPFRAIARHRSWLSPTVSALAATIYQERAFDRMPILADALEDAGCGDQDILGHCRQGGEHVQGCWVIDVVLGKT